MHTGWVRTRDQVSRYRGERATNHNTVTVQIKIRNFMPSSTGEQTEMTFHLEPKLCCRQKSPANKEEGDDLKNYMYKQYPA